jgi:hypothetical protein
MTSNKRPILILLVMLVLAMVVGTLVNRDRTGGLLTSLDGKPGQEHKASAPETPAPAETPAKAETAPPPAQAPAAEVQTPAGPLPFEQAPGEPLPPWRAKAFAILYAIIPELAPPIPTVYPEAAPLPERSQAELAAERAQAMELAAKALKRIVPEPAQPAQPAQAQAAEAKPEADKGKPLQLAAKVLTRVLAPPKAGQAKPAAEPTGQAGLAAQPACPGEAKTAAARPEPGPEGSSPRARAQAIDEITVECGPSECVLRIETRNPVERVSYFQKIQPSRLAVDLHGSWIFRGPNVLPGSGDFVARVRVGVHPDRFRVVLDYAGDQCTTRGEPTIEKQGNTLLVKIAK